MQQAETTQSRVVHALVRDAALARDLEGITRDIHAELRQVSSAEAIGPRPLACLVEASLLGSAQDQAILQDQVGDDTEIILLGDARQRERLAGWLRTGRAFYLGVPLDQHHLTELLRDILSEQAGAESGAPATKPPVMDQFGLLYGSSDSMRELYRHLRKAARTDATLLICGESGTGKELIARSAHSYSERSEEGFEGINCGAIPSELLESELFGHEKGSFTGADRSHRGLFERSGNGTLFLDEITEMPLSAQTRLLRVLETGRFRRVGGQSELQCRARIMAASNRNPLQAIEDGELRQDLYYRICQMEIHAPPLRERGEDIVHLARLFTRMYSQQTDRRIVMSEAAEHALHEHDWPGNVRELRHCIQTAARLSRGTIERDDLELRIPEPQAEDGALAPGVEGEHPHEEANAGAAAPCILRPGMRIADAEKELIELTLRETEGNKEQAARLLGISVRTLYNRLASYQAVDSG